MNCRALISICTASLLVLSILFYVSVVSDLKYEVNSVYEGWLLRYLDDKCYIALFTLNEKVFWMIERDVVLKLTLGEIGGLPERLEVDGSIIGVVRSYFPENLQVKIYVTNVVLSEYNGEKLDPVLTSSLGIHSNMLTGAVSYDLKLKIVIMKSSFTISRVFNLKAIHPARMYSLTAFLNKFNKQLSNVIKSYTLINTSLQLLASNIYAFLRRFSEDNLKDKCFKFNVVLSISIDKVDKGLYHVYVYVSKIRFSDSLYRVRYMSLNSLASVSKRSYGFHYVVNGSNAETGYFTIKYSYP